ncbi:hypothetical protein DEA98_16095 [Brucella pseudogrignonensis]|jgi:hypothetical protein|uniref:Uncharacterized protein n=1 Tax=Brucella pseudogrignonensis TaxID=419475 RepID=A0A7Y3WWB9_9HYPH|nr:hypothetical protein [Brucella pseudogrignonensis]MCM0752224.1 hypothetical protein [Brucella pseudogrignonensis]NNV19961.1 hypothetical protein [Brucella pseudogrignonensis]
MPWIKFSGDFNHRVTPAVTVAYKAGWSGLVTTPCAAAAIASGKASRLKTPRKGELPNVENTTDA